MPKQTPHAFPSAGGSFTRATDGSLTKNTPTDDAAAEPVSAVADSSDAALAGEEPALLDDDGADPAPRTTAARRSARA